MQKIEAIECFSNISLQEHFRVTAAKPLKQLYYPLIWGTKKVNKTHLILAGDLRKLIKKLKNSIFVSKWISQGRDFILINHWYIRGTLTLKRMIFPKMHHLKRGETLAFCDF